MTVDQPTGTSARRAWKTWQVVAIAAVALLVGVGLGAAGSGDEEPEAISDADESPPAEVTTTAAAAEETTTTTAAPTTTTTTAPPQPVEVLRVDGNADTETDDFVTDGRWTLHWQVVDGAGVNILLVDSATHDELDIVSAEPGESASQFRQSCACYLSLSTFGSSYTIWVVDEP